MELDGMRIVVLAGEGVEDLEYWVTVMRLRAAGGHVVSAGLAAGVEANCMRQKLCGVAGPVSPNGIWVVVIYRAQFPAGRPEFLQDSLAPRHRGSLVSGNEPENAIRHVGELFQNDPRRIEDGFREDEPLHGSAVKMTGVRRGTCASTNR